MIPKRAVGALLTTVFALVLLFSFKPSDNIAVTGTTTGGTVAVGAAPSASGTTGSTSGSAVATPVPSTAGSTGTPSTTTGTYQDGTSTGSVVSTRYGNVQVEVTISGGAITDVTALQLPDRDGRSQRIGTEAEPILRQEALTAQSANIDLLSGATYTSDGYVQSLQSALDKVQA